MGSPGFAVKGGRIWGREWRLWRHSRPQIRVSTTEIPEEPIYDEQTGNESMSKMSAQYLLNARTADADRGSLAKGGEEKSPYVSNLS